MDKIRIREKDLNKSQTIALNYCKLQELFNSERPTAYIASNAYGWRCDIYTINGVDLSTGYAPIGIKPSNEIINKYENIIKEISKIINYEEREQAYKNALINFTNEAYKNIRK